MDPFIPHARNPPAGRHPPQATLRNAHNSHLGCSRALCCKLRCIPTSSCVSSLFRIGVGESESPRLVVLARASSGWLDALVQSSAAYQMSSNTSESKADAVPCSKLLFPVVRARWLKSSQDAASIVPTGSAAESSSVREVHMAMPALCRNAHRHRRAGNGLHFHLDYRYM